MDVFFPFIFVHNLIGEGRQPKRAGVVWVACVGRTCQNDESMSQNVFVFLPIHGLIWIKITLLPFMRRLNIPSTMF